MWAASNGQYIRPPRFFVQVVLRGDGAPHGVGLGYDWAIEQTAKCIGELVALVRPEADDNAGTLFADAGVETRSPPP